MARRRHIFFHRLHAVLRGGRGVGEWESGRVGRGNRFFLATPITRFFLLSALTALCVVGFPIVSAMVKLPGTGAVGLLVSQMQASSQLAQAESLMQHGQRLYESGQLNEATAVLQRAIATYQSEGNVLGQAMALRNLSLVYQQLGEWGSAEEAIASSLSLLNSNDDPSYQAALARSLDIQGRLQLSQGQAEAALVTWERSTAIYQELGDQESALRGQINQAQALQSLGFYRRAIALLTPLAQTLEQQPDSLTKAVGLRSLGDALRVGGNLPQSREVLQSSLAVAERLQNPEAISAAQFSLGNTARAQQELETALEFYRQAIATSPSNLTRTQAQINQFSLLVETDQTPAAQALIPLIQTQLEELPASRAKIYAQVNFAQTLSRLGQMESTLPSTYPAQLLVAARTDAQSLADTRAESFALGSLGALYEQTQQWAIATDLTEQALSLAQVAASDTSYRWQWQLGRILKAQADIEGVNSQKYEGAIAAYSEAVNTLQTLRNDLVAVNPEVQLSFQESIEPIHRELVSLLLKPGSGDANPANLEKARTVIESLQLAELDNFLREACLDAQPVQIDDLDRQAAVIYPILLADRLEVVISLPGQNLRHYATPLSSGEVESVVEQLRQSLVVRTSRQFLPLSRQLYDWLIRPVEADLAASEVKTLVFVPDGVLRNIPMAVLNDGVRFLIEQYSIALTPGLQLLDPRPLQIQQLTVLTAGLSESRQGFSALPNVLPELEQIQSEVPSRILVNQEFTSSAFQQAINTAPAAVIHLATHGKFSSELTETFILTWDDRININQLNSLLQATDLGNARPIELLVLSACQTAVGDRQAALGLAGVAVRAGARSTLATLWQVSDEATALLMSRFYSELANNTVTKAEALRRAQLSILEIDRFRRHPFYWAAYVMVGNWL
jgi:CHAT domain-containing protein